MSTKTHVGALKPFSACCCMISSCFLEWPNCIGCEGEGEMLCIEGSWKALKTMDANADGNEDSRCCACLEAGVYCIKPKTCIQLQQQYFCMDVRCSLPCNKQEVPCLCTWLPCCVLFADWKFKFGCCKQIHELIDGIEENGEASGVDVVVNVNGAPSDVEMAR